MDEQTIKEKLKFYSGKDIEVHIVKKKNSEYEAAEWLNCFVISEKYPGVFVIKERKFGTMHIFASEIFSIEEKMEIYNRDNKKDDYANYYSKN